MARGLKIWPSSCSLICLQAKNCIYVILILIEKIKRRIIFHNFYKLYEIKVSVCRDLLEPSHTWSAYVLSMAAFILQQ